MFKARYLLSAALAPAVLLFFYIRKKDKTEPEPMKMLLQLVGLGALSTIPAIIIELVLTIPLAAIFVVAYLPIPSTIKYTVFFLLAMPSATSSVMMAVRFGKDSDFATVCVLLSTVLSVITLPLLYLFMNGVLKIPL